MPKRRLTVPREPTGLAGGVKFATRAVGENNHQRARQDAASAGPPRRTGTKNSAPRKSPVGSRAGLGSSMTFLIYGATGYTGELIAREAKRRGLSPILAGRSAEKLASLARELGLPTRVFGLERPNEIAPQLAGVRVVLHCAGPFSATSAKMIDACLLARAHYLDITGEIDVLEQSFNRDESARRAGIVICSGAGFDVIPTDCLALALKEALPDA